MVKEGYKDTEIGVIPVEWDVAKLENISKITMGQSPKSDTYNTDNIGIPLIQGNADCKNRKTIPRTYTTELTKECFIGDIIMTVRAPVGAISKSLHNACIGRGVCSIKSKEDNEYIYHCLVDYEDKWDKLSQGSTFTAVSGSDIKNLKFPLPPLKEQEKIADILSTADDKIDAIASQIQKAETLKKGLLQKLLSEGIGHSEFKDSELGKIPVGWEVVEQQVVATFYNGRAYKLSEWEEVGTPVIRLQNLTGSGKEYYYSQMELPEHQYCSYGDLLYMWSATFGPVWWKGEKAIYHYHIWKITTREDKLDKNFLFYLLNQITERMKSQSHGSTMMHVTKGGMEKLKIQLPPIEEQREIANILSTADAKLEVLRAKKEKYETLKKGLMQKLLTGEVRVKL